MTICDTSIQPVSPEELAQLLTAVRTASDTLLSLWQKSEAHDLAPNEVPASLDVRTKSDGSLVSRADFLSNEILSQAITDLFPDDRLISEEDIEPDSSREYPSGTRSWIIDPLDGTSAFLQGRNDFSVLVGLWSEVKPLLGIMSFPARNIVVIAENGKGCSINGSNSMVSRFAQPRAQHIYMRNFVPIAPELACSPRDSGLALMQVATGELDAAIIKMTTHRVWDVAAPCVAIVEAGGTVTDENGVPLSCGSTVFRPSYVVASNSVSHEFLLGTLIPRG